MNMIDTLRVGMALRWHPHQSRADLEGFQAERLRRLVEHAYERVPYYRGQFDQHGVRPQRPADAG